MSIQQLSRSNEVVPGPSIPARLRRPDARSSTEGIGARRARAARTARSALARHHPGRRALWSLVATSFALTYVGGAAMYWTHAVYRGEQGPPIAHPWHWLLDSTLGFLALTPVLLVVIPLSRRMAAGRSAGAEAVALGGLFAFVTAPGPLLHGVIAGAGTPLARWATALVGSDPGVQSSHVHAVDHSAGSEVVTQLVVGVPVYITVAFLAGLVLRRVGRRQPSRSPLHHGATTNPLPALERAA
jgi:hypothetical protein